MKRFRLLGVLIAIAVFTVPAHAASDLNSVRLYPNPVRVHQGDTGVTMDNLTDEADILIFKLQGGIVREVHQAGATSFVWDLKNDAGKPVASGVYIVLITNSAGHKFKGKLAVIR